MATPSIHDVDLSAAGHDFRLRVYPASEPTGDVLIWLHGGAFLFGDLEMPEADATARGLTGHGVTVISVDYTLAPLDGAEDYVPSRPIGTRPRAAYPVASLQVVATFDWAVENAASLGGDPARVSLGGASAGANLAAGAALRLRDRGETQPFTQVLVYPALHLPVLAPDAHLAELLAALPATANLPPDFGFVVTRNYLGDASPDELYAFPGGHDLRGSAPALIISAETDELRPSAEAYVGDLARGGVDVEYRKPTGTLHGFLNTPTVPGQREVLAQIAQFLRRV
ncbi:hypothetical protein ASD65_13325 [Microbacterium sp. Root61]|uniref:alpha/beta hydrolase n=1 Tax=Microbacterium sp. Root61 TaxID=1736570 RepID=UPI0007010A7B|nr:alpha/beta hydrolase fold domain-containing protein [Microbacterium sp. Root61]KRA25293.1 hypothetical protein ASD65_13325 [Microbacterium sp. Root61]